MISTLPTWITALVDDVCLEVAIVRFVHGLKAGRSCSHEGVWWIKVVDGVSQSHCGFYIDGKDQLIGV